MKGLVSKFVVGAGRNGTDRQFFFVNGRPCAPAKVHVSISRDAEVDSDGDTGTEGVQRGVPIFQRHTVTIRHRGLHLAQE